MTAPDAAGIPDSRSTPGTGQAAYEAFRAIMRREHPGVMETPTEDPVILDAWEAAAQAAIAAAAPAGTGAPGTLVARFRDEHGQILAETRFSPDAERKIAIPLDAEHMQVHTEQPQPAPELAAAMAALADDLAAEAFRIAPPGAPEDPPDMADYIRAETLNVAASRIRRAAGIDQP